MEDKDRKLLEFLLYSYFGSPDLNTQNINVVEARKACAHRAYQDLVRTIQYTYSTSELSKKRKEGETDFANKFDDCKKGAVEDVCKAIVDAIGSYTEGKNFDEWHLCVCGHDDSSNDTKSISGIMRSKETCNSENLVSSFSFGQAQKWLNMTLKYCWLLKLLPDAISEEDLHIPVDSYIIDCLWDVEGLAAKEAFPGVKTAIYNKPDNARPSSYIKSWSTWTYQEYADFRSALKAHSEKKNIKYDLEWEHTSWIEMAKQRAND